MCRTGGDNFAQFTHKPKNQSRGTKELKDQRTKEPKDLCSRRINEGRRCESIAFWNSLVRVGDHVMKERQRLRRAIFELILGKDCVRMQMRVETRVGTRVGGSPH